MSMIDARHQDPTRRTFLGAAGAAAAAGVLGAAPAAFAGEGASSASASADAAWDGEYDVIVVGAGLAGLTAAATVAVEGNGATCLLLEKGATPIGNSRFAYGSFIVADDVDAAMTYMRALQDGTECTPEETIRALVESTTDSYTFMVDKLGAPAQDIQYYPGTIPTEEERQANPRASSMMPEYPEMPFEGGMGSMRFGGSEGEGSSGFSNIVDFMVDWVERHPETIDYRTETPMTDLVADASGAAIGVVCGEQRFRAAKGVIMCCGGFESDPNMIYDYLGVKGAFPAAGMGNTGDGHRACAKLGADMWHMHSISGFWNTTRSLDNTRFLQMGAWDTGMYAKDQGITVAVNGRRFYMDHDGCTTGGLFPMGSDLTRNWGFRHGHTQWGGHWTALPMPETSWFIFDANGLANEAVPSAYTTDPVADGYAYTADTIEELAEQCGVPAEELAHTVEVWNQFCEDGEDLAFQRPVSSLNPIVQAPFYAVRCAPHFLNTHGGPVRSPRGEVLRPDGTPIPGLYSAGEFGSIVGAIYQAGFDLGEAAGFGRLSARTVLKN